MKDGLVMEAGNVILPACQFTIRYAGSGILSGAWISMAINRDESFSSQTMVFDFDLFLFLLFCADAERIVQRAEP